MLCCFPPFHDFSIHAPFPGGRPPPSPPPCTFSGPPRGKRGPLFGLGLRSGKNVPPKDVDGPPGRPLLRVAPCRFFFPSSLPPPFLFPSPPLWIPPYGFVLTFFPPFFPGPRLKAGSEEENYPFLRQNGVRRRGARAEFPKGGGELPGNVFDRTPRFLPGD